MNNVLRKLPMVARILLGLVFFVSGLNGFLHFIPNPPVTGRAGEFMDALAASGYMFSLVKGVEVVAGAMLLVGRFVPLALTLLAPIIVNILAYHTILAPEGAGMTIVLTALEIYLAYSYRAAFAPMLRAQVEPHSAEPANLTAKAAAAA